MLAPPIERHFPQLIDERTATITHLTGPLLAIAGPGFGKNFPSS